MLQKKSYLIPCNKLNIWWVSIIHIYEGFYRKIAYFNSFVKSVIKITKLNNILKKKAKINGLVNLTKKNFVKNDYSFIKFKINSIILLKKKLLPYGKEIFNPTLYNLKKKKFLIFFSFFL